MTPEVVKMLVIGLAAGLGFFGPALALGLIRLFSHAIPGTQP